MALESKVFFEVVKKHGLVSEKQLLYLEKAIQKDKLSQADLDTLVSKNYLTKWQVTRLVSGKHNFTVGQFSLLDYVGKDAKGEVYLVGPRNGEGGCCRLRLVAKAISTNPEQIKSYLERVHSFQAIQNPNLSRVIQVAEVGGRHIVVSDLPAGKSAASESKQSFYSLENVAAMVQQVGSVIGDLQMADLTHGSVSPNSVFRTDAKGWCLDLPQDIGFSKPDKEVVVDGSSDVNALSATASGLLSQAVNAESSESPVLTEKINILAANPAISLDDLNGIFSAGPQSTQPATDGLAALEPLTAEPDILEPEIVEPEVVQPEVVEPAVVEPAAVEPVAVVATETPAQAAEAIGPAIVGPAPVAKVDPSELAGIVISTDTNSEDNGTAQQAAAVDAGAVEVVTQDANAGQQPSQPQEAVPEVVEAEVLQPEVVEADVVEVVPVEPVAAVEPVAQAEPQLVATESATLNANETPAQPVEAAVDVQAAPVELASPMDASAGGLESIEKQDDVFGDFDQVEVVSEIQAPVAAAMPVVVEGVANPATATMAATQPAKSQAAPDEAETQPAGNKKMLVLAAAGGGGLGVVILGLVIFFLTRGNGNSQEKQVASNGNAVAVKGDEGSGDGNKSGETPKKDAKENTTKGVVQKELKSSGLFKGIGEFNKNDPAKKKEVGNQNKGKQTPGKNDAKTKAVPKATNDKGKADNKQNPNANKGAPNAGKGGGAKTGGTSPDPGKTKQPNDPKKTVAKNGGKEPAKNPADGKDKAKEEKKDDNDGVLLIGAKKKDSKKEAGNNASKLVNPFTKSADFVSLTPPKKGSDNSAFQKLLPLKIPPSLPLTVTLHGGDHASKSKVAFALKASTSENATWIVSAGSGKQLKPIGQFHFDGKDFGFNWKPEAENLSNSVYLMNCALRIQASQYKHELALRPPTVSSMLDFSKAISPKGDAKLENPPNMEYVKIELILPPKFPEFTYPKNKKILINRADSMNLAFRDQNIDILQGVFANKQRGSKMVVNLDLKYVTVDKQFQPMTTMDKFEKLATKIIKEAEQLEARLNQVNVEYNKIKDAEQKKEFTRLTGRTKLVEQVTVARRYKGHFQATLDRLKAIATSKVGFRIYYQAGEIEVDLATPDGKKFSRPQPAPAKQQKGKAKKK